MKDLLVQILWRELGQNNYQKINLIYALFEDIPRSEFQIRVNNFQLHDMLNKALSSDDSDDDDRPDHDFDRVDQSNCNYNDDGKGLQVDVEDILGLVDDGVGLDP